VEKLSVIIATLGDAIATNLTIAQIIAQLERDGLEYEIVVVDNGSNDSEKAILRSFLNFHKDFPIFYYEHNIKGTIPPHSFGVTKATGKYITMPDPHVILSPDYFKVMLETLIDLKSKGVEVVFSPFSIGTVAKKGEEYVASSHLVKPNPFGKTSSMGETRRIGDKPFPVLSCTISGMVCEKEWFLKIGNMFPDAFVKAGGHTAESLMVGIPTWMFGKKCYTQPAVVFEHPVYRNYKGEGWSGAMFLSMATGAYILGGQKYLDDMPNQYGAYTPGQLEEIPIIAKEARQYIQDNAKYTLDELVERWEEIREM
jgi:glycosyltransferase involved in cell wall biosynthesis